MSGQDVAGFLRFVDACVQKAVSSGTTGFGPLLRAIPGIYPSVARDSLRRLAGQGVLAAWVVERVLNEVSVAAPRPPHTAEEFVLPVAHPLDYEWRYAEAA